METDEGFKLLEVGVKFELLDDVWEAYTRYALKNNFIIKSVNDHPPTATVAYENTRARKFICWYNCLTIGVEAEQRQCPAQVHVERTMLGQWDIKQLSHCHYHHPEMKNDIVPICGPRDRKRQRVTAATVAKGKPNTNTKVMTDLGHSGQLRWIDSFLDYKGKLGGIPTHQCKVTSGPKGRAMAWLESSGHGHGEESSKLVYIDTSAEIVDNVPYILALSVYVSGKKKVIGGDFMEALEGTLLQWCFAEWRKELYNIQREYVICAWGCLVDEAISKAFDNPHRLYPMWKIVYEITQQVIPIVGGRCKELIDSLKRAQVAVDKENFHKIWAELCEYDCVKESPLIKYLYLHREKWALYLQKHVANVREDWHVGDKDILCENIYPHMGFLEFVYVYKKMLKC